MCLKSLSSIIDTKNVREPLDSPMYIRNSMLFFL